MNRLSIVRTSAYGPVSTTAPARQPRPACAGADPELFFAHALATAQVAEAKAICATCPLKASCLQGALERGEHGVWGGTDDDDRSRMKRRAARRRARAAA
ncbi:WhiB family transcriptional regulator [Streptomyces sp. NPDC060366]|uniref:WhiB family transcriptional regulator n=1 Tax=Streptomyces sp. NPDC060366 TaxID=3347105 RepID=UPI00364A6148